jgi:hypothetical protein
MDNSTRYPRLLSITYRTSELSAQDDASRIEALCLDCGSPLDLHQPDPVRPEHCLCTCSHCGLWHLLEQIDGAAVLCDLANVRVIHAVSEGVRRRKVREEESGAA